MDYRAKQYVPQVTPARRWYGRAIKVPSKPWLELFPDETEVERQRRLSHTCYHCGHFEVDLNKLDLHEAGHERS